MASSDIVTTSSRTSDKGSERPYPYPSHVNAASFVSIKLSGKANYDLWKEQMMCLVESHDMVDFIDGKVRKPRNNESKYKDWKRSDTLVKGWIFGSLSEDVMDAVVGQDTAKDVWSNLRKTFRTRAAPTTRTIKKGSQRPYPYPSHVNAASFVSIKLSCKANYDLWKEQMMSLVESHDMVDFIDGKVRRPRKNESKYKDWKRSDTLVKGWIFGSLSEVVMDVVVGQDTAKDVWSNLRKTFRTRAAPTTRTIKKGSQPFLYPSDVNAASILSIKLSGKANYEAWKKQMICHLESHDMVGFTDGKIKPMEKSDSKYWKWKRSDTLVKGWIFGSLSEEVMRAVVSQDTAKDVWSNLSKTYSTRAAPPTRIIKKEYRSLHEAILSGEWEKARDIFISDNNALTGKINNVGDSALHVAISTCKHIPFVEDLLKEINRPELLPDLVNSWWGQNPLHRAALIGNTEAAEMLVKENPSLLFKMDKKKYLPIHRAVFGSHEKTFKYLLKVTKDHIKLSEKDGNCSPFEGENSGVLLASVIDSGFLDSAYDLIKDYPNMATEKKEKYIPLNSIAGKMDAYYSGTQYSLYQKFVYFYMLEKIEDEDNVGETEHIENPDTNKAKIVAKGSRSCFHPDVVKENDDVDNARETHDIENPDTNKAEIDAKGSTSYSHTDMLEKNNDEDNARETQHIENPDTNKAKVVGKGNRSCFHPDVEENDDVDNIREAQSIENPDTNKAEIDAKGSRSYFHTVILKIYAKFWQVALPNVVPQMKHLKEDKVKHNIALKVLKCICKEVGELSRVDQDIGEDYLEAMTLALENDIPEPIKEIVRYIPQAIWTKHNGYHLTQFVIINRCEKVYNLLVHKMVVTDKPVHKRWYDDDGNNLLHLAGRLAPMDKLNLVSGAALQMQRELQWFQEVEKFVMHRHMINEKNDYHETPMMVFRREHQDLRKEGEEWMKKTADSYTITAALIITIVFAAAITVPGGNDGNTGKAIFAKEFSFIIFAVSDAFSLFSSTTSLLLFLSILTARYREVDFLDTLPKRLIIGLAMLFLAVTSMMVAFSATLYIMFGREKGWILIPIAALTCLPIASFVTLQLPLLRDLISSTCGHGIFDKKNGHRIK